MPALAQRTEGDLSPLFLTNDTLKSDRASHDGDLTDFEIVKHRNRKMRGIEDLRNFGFTLKLIAAFDGQLEIAKTTGKALIQRRRGMRHDQRSDMTHALVSFQRNAEESRRSNTELKKCAHVASHDLRTVRELGLTATTISYRLHLKVENDGPSILPHYQTRISELLQTLRRRDDIEVNALGLNFVKKLVQHRKGTVTAASESAPQRWTNFKVALPFLTTHPARNALARPVAA